MRILLVDVPEPLGLVLRPMLASRHDIATLEADPRDEAAVRAVSSCDVVVQGYPEATDELTAIDRASRGTWNVLTMTGARRYVQLSSMRIFDSYAPGWAVSEMWLPRPTADSDQLVPYLAELTSLELSRSLTTQCVVLRLDRVVSGADFDHGPVGIDWLHVNDATTAIVHAVERTELPRPQARWQAVHIVRGGGRYPLGAGFEPAFGFVPRHPAPGEGVCVEPPELPPAGRSLSGVPAPRQVTVYGAGGPLSAAMVDQLGGRYPLVLTDLRPLAHFAAAAPQSHLAPRPRPATAPDREEIVDITEPESVLAAAAGSDCLVNCSVVRTDPVHAFRVNVLGAYNVMRAAVRAGIPRVVFTGPTLTLTPHPVGYAENRAIDEAAPARPGAHLYYLTKYLGQEISRLFAEAHGIACPSLLFCSILDPARRPAKQMPPFVVSWADAGRAMVAAIEVSALPEPCPSLNVLVASPHDRYGISRAGDVLGWQPRDRLDHVWYRT